MYNSSRSQIIYIKIYKNPKSRDEKNKHQGLYEQK